MKNQTSSYHILTDRVLWSRVWEFGCPHRRWLAAIAALGIGATLASLVVPILYAALVADLVAGREVTAIAAIAAAIVALSGAQAFLRTKQTTASGRLTAKIGADLQTLIFDHLQRQEQGFFKVSNSGAITARTVDETSAAALVFFHTLALLLNNVAPAVLTAVVLLLLDWRAIVPLALLLFALIRMRKFEGRYRQAAFDQFVTKVELTSYATERLNGDGNLLTKLNGDYQREAAAFQARSERMWEVVSRVLTYQGVVGTSVSFAVNLVTVLILLGSLMLDEPDLGRVLAIIIYLRLLELPLAGLAEARLLIARDLIAFTRVLEVLDALPRNPEPASSAIAVSADSNRHDGGRRGRLEFEDVAYVYPRRSEMAVVPTLSLASEIHRDNPPSLMSISFVVEPGTTVAIVGRSGAGKSTIAMLAAGILTPKSGCVTIDGVSVRDQLGCGASNDVAYVTQDTYLLHDTLRANLLYACPEASERDLHAACVASGVHQFAWDLPLRYQTLIGENGTRLSGGERQRMALARAILRRPSVVILDEATAHLDVTTEEWIRAALADVFADRSRLVIAHRLSAVQDADKILVLEKGTIVERGNHESLLAERGVYSQFFAAHDTGR